MDGFSNDAAVVRDSHSAAVSAGPTDNNALADQLLGTPSRLTLPSLDGASSSVAAPNHEQVNGNNLSAALDGFPAVTLADYRTDNSDHIPRPPRELGTGQKLAGVVDVAASLGSGYYALKTFHREGLQVLQTDLRSLDKFVRTPELEEFRTLGHGLSTKVDRLAGAAQDDVVAMQFSKPHLFENTGSLGNWKGNILRPPNYAAMAEHEAGVVDRASDLRYISDNLRKSLNYSSPAQFRNNVEALQGLHTNPAAVSEGLAEDLIKLEDLGRTVSDQAAGNSLTMAAQSRGVFMRNLGVVGAGIATNYVIEKTLLKDSSPSLLTIGTDIASPFIVLTDLPIWAKFGVIVGAHAAARLAEYGMREAGQEKT